MKNFDKIKEIVRQIDKLDDTIADLQNNDFNIELVNVKTYQNAYLFNILDIDVVNFIDNKINRYKNTIEDLKEELGWLIEDRDEYPDKHNAEEN